MGKYLIIILFAFALMISCDNNPARIDSFINSVKQDGSIITNKTNPFFFQDIKTPVLYDGTFTGVDDAEAHKVVVQCHIVDLGEYAAGILYAVNFELKDRKGEMCIEERLRWGYFYVESEQIYRITSNNGVALFKNSSTIPDDSVVVCNSKDVPDKLNSNEAGWHQFIKMHENFCEFHSYNTAVETGYFEDLIWEKGRGLVKYRSGFGAEKDLFELDLR